MSSHTYNCGYPLCPENIIEFTSLDFGDYTLETNHNVTCEDLVDLHMDSKFFCCMYCGKNEIDLDLHKKHRPMCKECLNIKVKVEVGKRVTSNNDKIDEAMIKVRKEKSQQITYFPILDKKMKPSAPSSNVDLNNNFEIELKVDSNVDRESIEVGKAVPHNKNQCLDADEPLEDYMKRLHMALRKLGLKKHSIPGLGDCQLLSVCLAYFGKKITMNWIRIRA